MKKVTEWLNTEDNSDYKEFALELLEYLTQDENVTDAFDQYILGKLFEQLSSLLKDGSKRPIFDSIPADVLVHKELTFSKRTKPDKYVFTDTLKKKAVFYANDIKERKAAEIENGDAEFEDVGTEYIVMAIFKG